MAFLESEATDDAFDFPCSGVSSALDDFSGKDNVFEVKDCEVVIVKFLGCVKGHDIV